MPKILTKKLAKWVLSMLLLISIVIVSLVAPIDFTPLEEQPFYQRMMTRLDTFKINTFAPTQGVQVGWSQFSIVPDYPMPLAGYKPRDNFTEVHDSVYIRILAISNGTITTYLISADLLLFPPALKSLILQKLGPLQNEFIYFSASHTHTSVGGWDPNLLGRILMGSYDEKWMEEVATNTIEHMEKAKNSQKSATLNYWETDVRNYVTNRLDIFAEVDSKFRGISVVRSDSTKALLFVLGAHPTFVSQKLSIISADFPSEIMAGLSTEYDFTQFMAGAVGSQRFRGFRGKSNFELTRAAGKLLSMFILEAIQVSIGDELTIKTGSLKVEHGKSQLRLTDNFKLRDWVFRAISKPLVAEITVLQLGNVLMLGTSCDFSGEISKMEDFEGLANDRELRLIFTSFNGEYTGYVTADLHYDEDDDEEVRILNWVGPYFGRYYTEIIHGVVDKASEK